MCDVVPAGHETAPRWRRYPAYKPCGIEWLGEIPEHWEKTHIKRLARQGYKTFIDGDWIESPFITNDGIRLIQTGNVGVGEYREQGFRYITEDTFRELTCTEVYPGDILICRLAEPVGRACIAPTMSSRMITSVDVCILKPRVEYDARFIVYSLSSEEYISWMQAICRGGTRDRVSRYMLGAIDFVLPSPEEQRAIADFLDHETAKIVALIAKKERLIELLQEKRTALISHAVTKGLDPTVPMKDSGIEWLGQIPTHWQMKRLKYNASEPLTYGANESAEMNDPELPRFIRITDINEDGTLRDDTFRSLPEEIAKEFLLKQGDLLLARSGATVGKSFMYQESWGRACHAGYLVRFRPDHSRVLEDFVSYFTRSRAYWDWLSTIYIQATIQNVSGEKYANLPVPIPPLPEQRAIAEYLDRETAKIDALIARVREASERLKEYRTALISAAVTGKIDVRKEA